MTSGKVLYQYNETERIAPASTTKIMTVMLAIEAIETGQVGLNDVITVNDSVTFAMEYDSSSVGLTIGEEITLGDLLYCAMVSSGNDACNAIADYISGSIGGFLTLMNGRAEELGCTGTHFANPHGMPNDDHYTTARDLYLISLAACEYPLLMEIANTKSVEIPETNKSKVRKLESTNYLIREETGFYYQYAAGIKTGHTQAAGYCLVSTAAKDDVNLLAVVMGSGYRLDGETQVPLSFTDTKNLYEWAFDNFSYRNVLLSTDVITEVPVKMGEEADYVLLRPETDVTELLADDEDISAFTRHITIKYRERGDDYFMAPVKSGEILGTLTLSKGDETVAEVNLVAAASVSLSKSEFLTDKLTDTWHSATVQLIFWVIVSLTVLYIFLVARYRILRNRHRRSVREAKLARARSRERIASPSVIIPLAREDGGGDPSNAPAYPNYPDDPNYPNYPDYTEDHEQTDFFEDLFK